MAYLWYVKRHSNGSLICYKDNNPADTSYLVKRMDSQLVISYNGTYYPVKRKGASLAVAIHPGINLAVKDILEFNGEVYLVGSVGINSFVFQTHGVAKWDGNQFSNVNSSLTGSFREVKQITTDGTDIFVGGIFTKISGVDAVGVARFDGSDWHSVGEPYFDVSSQTKGVCGLRYGGGLFAFEDSKLHKWDGAAWTAVRSHSGSYFGGGLTIEGSNYYAWRTREVRRHYLDGGDWASETIFGTGGTLYGSTCVFYGNGGLYVGFSHYYDGSYARLRRWNGATLDALGGYTLDGGVYAIAYFKGDIYIGGSFTKQGDVGAETNLRGFAKYNPNTDTFSEIPNGNVNGTVYALKVVADKLYLGGIFETIGDTFFNNIATWDGNSFSVLVGD